MMMEKWLTLLVLRLMDHKKPLLILHPFLFITGPNIKTALAILNCILARQLCFEDPSCSAILEIIPRVCGPVPGKNGFKLD